MLVYITGTVLTVLFTYVALHIGNSRQCGNETKRLLSKTFSILSFIPLTFIMAVRYSVGTDYQSYTNAFLYGNSRLEKGYELLTDFIHVFTNNAQWVFIVTSLIICFGYFFVIYKESLNPVYSVLLFVLCKDYFASMNIMRQYISTAIIILAIPFVKKKEWVKAAIIFMVAFSFHKSVIVFLAVLVLYLMDIRPFVSVAIMTGLALFAGTIKDFIYPILLKSGFYYGYFSSQSHYYNAEGNFDWQYMLIFLCFFIMLTYEYNIVRKSKELKLMYAGVLFCLFSMSMSMVLPFVGRRLTMHMNSLIVLYTPHAIKAIQDKRIALALKIIIPVAYAIVTGYDILHGNQGVLPYQTFWSR